MRNIHITLAYDGTGYVGFQRQENGLAIQELVETALERILGVKTTLYFVARTDSGVHAWSQECTFFTEKAIPSERIGGALNALLPLAVRVRAAREVPVDYSVRRSNTGKTYVYQILRSRAEHPFMHRYVWRVAYDLDMALMRQAADLLVGTHDFTGYRGKNSVPANPVWTMYDVRIVEDGGFIRIYVTGDGFLYHMVRNIAGALVDVGRGKITLDTIQKALITGDRGLLGMTAPAAGLCLLHVYFGDVSQMAMETVFQTDIPIWRSAVVK